MADTSVPPSPPTRREDVVDVLHGVAVHDPYRWLEDGDTDEVIAWVAAHNERTRQALDARPDGDRWRERLGALMALPTVLSAQVRGDRVFSLERAEGADQFALMVRPSGDEWAAPVVLVDPAALAADGAVAIDWYAPSPDGSLVAFGLSEGGTEDSTLHVLDVAGGVMLSDRIPDTRAASVAWWPDGDGFWYARYPAGERYRRHIRSHRLGDDPHLDPVVFDRLPTEQSWPDVSASADGRYVLVTMLVGWGRYDVHLLDTTTGDWRVVVEGVDAISEFTFAADGLIGVTTLDAPSGRVVVAPFDRTAEWTTLIAERPGTVVTTARVHGRQLLVVAATEAIDRVETYSLDGGLATFTGRLALPDNVAVSSLDAHDGWAVMVVSTFERPPSLWTLTDDGTLRTVHGDIASEALPELSVSHVHYPSLDGTEIGLFLIHRADVTPSPTRPLVLNGYGGFAIAETPMWLPNLAAWCAAGGVWAIAGLRGGYEHGQAWHDAGRRANKQHVFDDFHAAADWLVATGRASHDRLAVVGGSNGGLLVGAALTQRPDLARAVWCAVPLLDMVRFPHFLIARLWTDEYGDPDVAEEFAWLIDYSPYHHVVPGTRYPAVLFTTAEGDTRVDPLHARKMAALLTHHAADQHERPVLLWQEGRAGHGVGKPASMRVREGADVLAFLAWQLGGLQP